MAIVSLAALLSIAKNSKWSNLIVLALHFCNQIHLIDYLFARF
jgi:hypothetical protein